MHGRRSAALLGLLVAAASVSGCATPGYISDRLNDAADIATVTLGTGAGLKARVGPVQLAVIQNSDIAGLRAGKFFYDGLDLLYNDELYVLPFPLPGIRTDRWYILPYGTELFSHERGTVPYTRGKAIQAKSPFPCFAMGRGAAYYSQIEVAGGLGLTARLGLNPGEFVDFLLGFLFVDIYYDDLSNVSGRIRH
jgi:hypothetical protein